jgi:two-component system, response regulator PdtaR
VLVVEDEPVTRHAAVQMLDDAGFAVIAAPDGIEAMRLLETVAGIRAVFTDIDMPRGMDGVRLAACLSQRWPGIGVVVTSGKRLPSPGDIPPGAAFFRKPYDEDAVLAAIAPLMARGDPPHR